MIPYLKTYRVVFNAIPPGMPDHRDVLANNKKQAISIVSGMFRVRIRIKKVSRLDN